jgi:hypothetical protein
LAYTELTANRDQITPSSFIKSIEKRKRTMLMPFIQGAQTEIFLHRPENSTPGAERHISSVFETLLHFATG